MEPTDETQAGCGDGMEIKNMQDEAEEIKQKNYEERAYQTFLFNKAKEENIIVCLPTGCGKTFIAVELVKYYLDRAIREKSKIIFIATTVPLVNQQGRYLKDHIGGNHVGIVTGDMKPEEWSGQKWKMILDKFEIFSMTDQILNQAVERAHIIWKNVCLLIVDECHNATGQHPMASLMAQYGKEPSAKETTRVLALTATIVNGNSKNINRIAYDIRDVENRFQSKAITYYNYDEVLRCSTSASINTIPYEKPRSIDITYKGTTESLSKILDETIKKIGLMEPFMVQKNSVVSQVNESTLSKDDQIFWNRASPLDDFSKQFKDIKEILLDMGVYCAKTAVTAKKAYFRYKWNTDRRRDKAMPTFLIFLYKYIRTQMDYITEQFEWYMYLMSYQGAVDVEKEQVLDLVSPRIKELAKTLRRASGTGENSEMCGIIFCQKRITSQMLCYYIQDLARLRPEDFGYLKCSYAVGTANNSNNVEVTKVAMRLQMETLEMFRNKKLNLLVATKVLEEGLDVPSCNFIVRFDPILTYPSYVQSMGRARQKGADFYILVPHESMDAEIKKIKDHQMFSVKLSDALKDNVEHPEKYLYMTEEITDTALNKKVPIFQPNSNTSATITAGSAIQLVYRYCEMLCSDKLSTLSPISWFVQNNRAFKTYVRLPPSACIKGVCEGGWYDSKYVSKKAAFLEVCKKLYENGVLHEKTLLPIPGQVPDYINQIMNSLDNGEETHVKQKGKNVKVGSKNRTQWYKKKIPNVFETASKSAGVKKIYGLQIQLEEYINSNNKPAEIKSVYDFGKMPYLYGLITDADLSKVPEFLLDSRDGNFKVSLKLIKDEYFFTEDDITLVKSFQEEIFSNAEILKMTHCVLKKREKDYLYIVPLRRITYENKDGKDSAYAEIAWDLIPRVVNNCVDYNAPIPTSESRTMTFTEDQFKDALVIPSYRPKTNERQSYYVLGVDTTRSPLSPFQFEDNSNYVDYFKKKYEIDIFHKNGPLIKLKPIAKQLNFLVAKHEKWKLTTGERRDEKFSNSIVYIPPELLRIHPLPGSLFVQAKFLPSCLHRIFRFLLAIEIMDSFSLYFNETSAVQNSVQNEQVLNNLKLEISAKIAASENNSTALNEDSNNKVIVSQPSSKFVQENESPFSFKRAKLWVEIEYIHPRDLRTEDLVGPPQIEVENLVIETPPPGSPSEFILDLPEIQDAPPQDFHKKRINMAGPCAYRIMEAMTLANGRDCMSLENAEMMGDSVLKIVASLHVFTHFPEFNEGQFTSYRSKLISNRHLYGRGAARLGEYLAGSIFEPETSWLPIGFEVPVDYTEIALKHDVNYSAFLPLSCDDRSDLETIDFSKSKDELDDIIANRVKNYSSKIQHKCPSHTSFTHSRMGDKSVADCVEALIGAYYVDGGLVGALRFMNWIGLVAPTISGETIPYQNVEDLPPIERKYPPSQQKLLTSKVISELENTLGYRFKNKWLIVEALTHATYMDNQVTTSYERLEFIGDAVLDFLITHFIYKTNRARTPGDLTDLRSALVNNQTFAALVVRYNFHKPILHFSRDLQRCIDAFVIAQIKNNHEATGVFNLIGDKDAIIAEDVEVPKVLGDIFESIIGAVFVDSGNNLDKVWQVVYRLMQKEIDLFSKDIPKNAIRQLYEKYPQGGEVKFVSVETDSDEFKVVSLRIYNVTNKFLGSGPNTRSAKMAAAKYALRALAKKPANST